MIRHDFLLHISLYSAWLIAKDISKLQTHEIESYIAEPYKRSGDLLSGYRIALDPTKWEEERAKNLVYVPEPEEDDAQVDQLDSDGASSKKSKAKKRKRESEGGTLSAKTRKPPKVKDLTEPKKKGTPKVRKNGPKSNAMVESEDEAHGEHEGQDDEDAGPSKKESPPPTKKPRREKGEEEGDDGKFRLDVAFISSLSRICLCRLFRFRFLCILRKEPD